MTASEQNLALARQRRRASRRVLRTGLDDGHALVMLEEAAAEMGYARPSARDGSLREQWARLEEDLERIDPLVAGSSLGRRAIAALVGGGLAALGLGVVWAEADVEHPPVYATTEIHGHPVGHALDGNVATEWQMYDLTTGSLELNVPRRHVDVVEIVNGRNHPWLDRAIDGFTLRVYDAGEVVHAVRGHLPPSRAPSRVISIPVDAAIDRVRLDIESFHGDGASLAELRLR